MHFIGASKFKLVSRIFHTIKAGQYRPYVQAVLGIETSCDDTGAAVIDAATGRLMGDALHSQQRTHTLHGGISPMVAQSLHKKNIDRIVQEAMEKAGLQFDELSAVATTLKPGLSGSLLVGRDYGRDVALRHSLPFIPIHHMEAHTLTVRMEQQVPFPFLCLLASGGHCLLVLCRDIDSYSVLGSALDDAPGEALDKGARTLNLRSLREFASMSGGAAIEQLAAEGGSHTSHSMVVKAPLSHYRDCNFSFAGLKFNLNTIVKKMEVEHGLDGDTALPREVLRDLSASYQHAVFQHITRRTHRALLYCETTPLMLDKPKTLVVSGGVASNNVLRAWLQKVCHKVGWSLVCPPAHLCTDNGIMIAWNGVERLRTNNGVLTRPDDIRAVDIEFRCPLGENISHEVTAMSIKVDKWIKM